MTRRGGGTAAPGDTAGNGRRRDALLIPEAIRGDLHRHLEAAYPREACGVLLGQVGDGTRRVTALHPAPNRWPDRNDRYLVDPGVLRRLLEAEEKGGARVLGFYHSHPDAPPEPSPTDLEYAWPWYHYLIVRVTAGRADGGRVWELAEGGFAERELRAG